STRHARITGTSGSAARNCPTNSAGSSPCNCTASKPTVETSRKISTSVELTNTPTRNTDSGNISQISAATSGDTYRVEGGYKLSPIASGFNPASALALSTSRTPHNLTHGV